MFNALIYGSDTRCIHNALDLMMGMEPHIGPNEKSSLDDHTSCLFCDHNVSLLSIRCFRAHACHIRTYEACVVQIKMVIKLKWLSV
jgi:hypothetical protein